MRVMKSSTLLQKSLSRVNNLNLNIQETFAKMIPSRKSVSIGVTIYTDRIRMIKLMGASTSTPVLLDYKCVLIPPQIDNQTSEYKKLLKSELNKFNHSRKMPVIWSIISSSQVDIRFINIPKTSKIQIEKAVYWAVKKEKPFDEEQSISDFKVHGEVIENGITKLSIMVYITPRDEIEKRKELFSSIGMPLAGITIMPFAFGNILRAGLIPNPGRTNAVLFVGNNFTRIDIYFQGYLVMTREIKAGVRSKIDSLIESFRDRSHSSSDEISEEQARKVLFTFSQDTPPLSDEDVGFGLTNEELLEMILPALKRQARQVKLTIDHYEKKPGVEKVDKIYISGVMDIYRPILEYMSSQLGINGSVLDPLNSQLIFKDLGNINERISYIPALGTALSDNVRTPNLLYTQKDRKKEARVARLNIAIFAAFMIAVFICSIIFVYQHHSIVRKKVTLASLNQQLAGYEPRLDKNKVLKMVADVTQRQEILGIYSKRYLGMAAISELSYLTPENIHIINLKAYLGDVSPAGKHKRKDMERGMVIDGIVRGEHHMLETVLHDYVMKLRTSGIFRQINIQRSSFASSNIGVVLDFTIKITIKV